MLRLFCIGYLLYIVLKIMEKYFVPFPPLPSSPFLPPSFSSFFLPFLFSPCYWHGVGLQTYSPVLPFLTNGAWSCCDGS